MVLLIGLFTYGVRGIFWATLDECDVSASTRGLGGGHHQLAGLHPGHLCAHGPVLGAGQVGRATGVSDLLRSLWREQPVRVFRGETVDPSGKTMIHQQPL